MRRCLVMALAFALAAAPIPAQARDVLRLQPTSPWNLHYADDNCRLGRLFGEGKQQVTLMLDQFEPGEEFRLLIVGEPVQPRRDTRPLRPAIRFGPDERESEETALIGTTDDKPALIFNGSQRLAPLTEAENEALKDSERRGTDFSPAPIGEAREAAATWMEITKALKADLVLETGPMGKPLASLRKCSWDTVAHWGLDAEQQKALTRRPHPKRSPSAWLHPSDYPKSMLKGGHEGIVDFLLMVNEAGRLTSCKIQASTNPKEFDDVVCRAVIRRAQFEPALDAQGKPVPSYWRATVRFMMQ